MEKSMILKKMSVLAIFFTSMSPVSAITGGARGHVALIQEVHQDARITGKVTDVNGDPIIGANIRLEGTSIGVISDLDGNFELKVPNLRGTLQVSYVGYKSKEIALSPGKSSYSIILNEDSEMLNEVVVVGYGTMKKSDITGSVTSVNTEQMMRRTPVNIAQGLQGAAAGVVVTQAGGDPTGGYSIRIRGVATMDGNTDPLWVVDGIQHGNASNLEWLDPNDVESIEILKDASATAIYGSRGANGVIMVTTKNGKAGRLNVDLKADFGISTLARKLDMASLSDWLPAYRQAIETDGKIPYTAYNGQYDNQLNEIDWQDAMTQQSFRQQYNLSLSGGTEALQANASIGYMDNKGIVVNSWHKRLTLRLGVNAVIKDIVKIGFNTNFNTGKGKGGGNLINYARTLPTMDYVENGSVVHVPLQYEDGSFGHWSYDPTTISYSAGKYQSNPYADQYVRRYQDDWDNDNAGIRNSAYIEVKILKGLTFRSNMNLNFSAANGWYYNAPYADTQYTWEQWDTDENGNKYGVDEFGTNGYAQTNYGIENYFTYDTTIKDHHLTLMIGQSASKTHGSWNNSSTRDLRFNFLRGFYSEDPDEYNNGNGAPNMSERFSSYFGRLNYAYKDRYLLTATIRRDGSSKFGADNRWGTFPSASLAWRASEEEFIKNLGIFSNLKVRFGWGRVGNANVNATDALPQLSSSGSYDFFNVNGERYKRYFGIAQTAEIDTGLMWESSEQTNFGLDLGFLNGDLNITLDYYIRDTKDLILNKAIRPSAGFTSIKTNFGKIRNQGLEFNISYNKQLNQDWFIGIALNGEASKNEAVDIGTGTTTSGPTGAGWENKQVCYNGLPLGTFQGYIVDHIITNQEEINTLNAKAVEIYGEGSYYDRLTTGPGDFLFKDLNGDGHITTEDKAYLGNGFPDLTYGLNLTASYKQWDASVYMYGALGQKILSWSKNYMTSVRNESEGYFNLLSDYAKNSWSTSNPNAPYPRLTRDDMSSNYRVSDYYVEKADYLKISNLQIGYTFKTNKIKNYISKARIYASVQNLLTISPYNKFGDPEVNGGVTTMGYDEGRYPFPRTFMFGVQLGF